MLIYKYILSKGGLHMKKTTSRFNKLYILLMLVCIVGFSIYIVYKYQILTEYNDKILQINKEIELENKKSKELENQAEYKNSPENIEKIARDKLGMVKSDEIIFYDEN